MQKKKLSGKKLKAAATAAQAAYKAGKTASESVQIGKTAGSKTKAC